MQKPTVKESSNQGISTNHDDWVKFREQMHVARKWAYLDHAAVAPIPKIAVERISKWAAEAAEDGDVIAHAIRDNRGKERLQQLGTNDFVMVVLGIAHGKSLAVTD